MEVMLRQLLWMVLMMNSVLKSSTEAEVVNVIATNRQSRTKCLVHRKLLQFSKKTGLLLNNLYFLGLTTKDLSLIIEL